MLFRAALAARLRAPSFFLAFAGLLNHLHRTATTACKHWDRFTTGQSAAEGMGRQKGWPHADVQQTARSTSTSLRADICGGAGGQMPVTVLRERQRLCMAGTRKQKDRRTTRVVGCRQVGPDVVKHALVQPCMFQWLTFDGRSAKGTAQGVMRTSGRSAASCMHQAARGSRRCA